MISCGVFTLVFHCFFQPRWLTPRPRPLSFGSRTCPQAPRVPLSPWYCDRCLSKVGGCVHYFYFSPGPCVPVRTLVERWNLLNICRSSAVRRSNLRALPGFTTMSNFAVAPPTICPWIGVLLIWSCGPDRHVLGSD